MNDITLAQVAAAIDHTILKPDTSRLDIGRICREAEEYQFAAVCVPPAFIKKSVKLLRKTPVRVATVLGFPMGYIPRLVKLYELNDYIGKGAHEIDMVINVGAIKDRRWKYVHDEIKMLTKDAHNQKAVLKVIIESGLLTHEEIMAACDVCADCGVDFVKTSTGFNGGGATVEVISLMRRILPPTVKIKASGGIRTLDQAIALMKAGADRLGCSRGVEIVSEFATNQGNKTNDENAY